MIKSFDQYITKHTRWRNELVLFRSILNSLELEEGIKWGAPTYMVNGKNVVGVGAFKGYTGLWFFNGALLKDKDEVLINAQDGKTVAMRQWRFRAMDEIDEAKIKEYVQEAILNQKEGREIKPVKSKELVIPAELKKLIISDENLNINFKKLTPYKQKEYAEYIAEAKRPSTKESRLAKIKPLILSGAGLNDKYR